MGSMGGSMGRGRGLRSRGRGEGGGFLGGCDHRWGGS